MSGDLHLRPVVRLAPAKLNLTLAVRGRRPDGYHELASLMVPLGLADRLSLSAAAGPADSLVVTGADAGPIVHNLVIRAIDATRAAVRAALGPSHATPFLAARLEKRIPVSAGLAGGSSDAAAAIDAALEAWGVGHALDRGAETTLRTAVASRLGSDVPFFLAGGAAYVTGRGEHVEPLPPLRGPAPALLLVTPGVPASTAAVFAALDGDPSAAPTDPRSTFASSEHIAVEWRAGLRSDLLLARAGVLASSNDLANAAALVVPRLRDMRRALVRTLGRPIGLSGSGPTLWVLYASRAEAAEAARRVGAAIDDGSIVAPGGDRPSIIATTIATTGVPPDAGPEQEDAS